MKLVDIVNELPRALAHRFDSSFWVTNANKVLQDLELKGDIPRVKDTYYLPIEEGVCSYKLPSFVKKVLRVIPNEFVTGFSLRQNRIIMDVADVLVGYSGSASVSPTANPEIMEIGLTGGKQATPLYKELVLVAQTDDQRNYAIQKLMAGTEETAIGDTRPVRLFKEYEAPSGPSNFLITDLVVPIEYVKAFEQAEDMLEDILEDTDIHRVLQEGLWYFALRHISPDGAEDGTSSKRAEYELEKRRWFNRSTRGMFKLKPRFGA